MENFVVSARKYRPATFASVVGQRHITSTLKNAIERGQLAHAYLFCGPRGVGKTTCARIFAKAINCLNPQHGEACNECESCRSFNENRSLNVHELDAASNNSVDDIRNLIEQVRIIPQQGRYSVFVIDEVHMLSSAAFNAFLKTLEEPPQHAVFILATTEKHKIIPTILSRCQIYDFNRIKVEDGVEYLRYIAQKEGITADDEALNLISHKADGGMRDALSMFDKAVSFCGTTLNYKDVATTLNVLDYDTYFSITEMLLAGRYTDALIAFDEVLAKGFSPQIFIAGLNAHMRDLLMAKGPAASLIEFTGTLVERYKQQATKCSEDFLFDAISLLSEADGKIRQSSNQRLLVELGLMKIAGLGQKKNEDTGTLSFATDIPLPPVGRQAQQVVAQQQAAAMPQTTATATPSNSVQSTPQRSAATAPRIEQPVAAPRQTTAQTTPRPEQPATAVPQHREQTPKTTTTRTKRGVSINSIINTAGAQQQRVETENENPTESTEGQTVVVDSRSEAKILDAKERIIADLERNRPRFAGAFGEMRVTKNVISIEVPSQELYEDIMRSKSELLMSIIKEAGIEGYIELEVAVNEKIKAARPITIEDRLRHLAGKNQRLAEMIDKLGLDAE